MAVELASFSRYPVISVILIIHKPGDLKSPSTTSLPTPFFLIRHQNAPHPPLYRKPPRINPETKLKNFFAKSGFHTYTHFSTHTHTSPHTYTLLALAPTTPIPYTSPNGFTACIKVVK